MLVEGEERTTVASRLQQMQQSAMYNEVLSEAELSDLDLTLQACVCHACACTMHVEYYDGPPQASGLCMCTAYRRVHTACLLHSLLR